MAKRSSSKKRIKEGSEIQKDLKKNPEIESQIINLEIQKSKLNIEKSTLIFNKGILIYFSFLFVGIIGVMQNYVEQSTFNLLIIFGMIAMIIGVIPYIFTTIREEKKLNDLLELLRKKRGLSPLIATVLLIAFAVALGAVVMNWGQSQLHVDSCESVMIDFETVNNVPQICKNNKDEIDLFLNNKGKMKVSGFKVNIIGSASQDSVNIDEALDVADTREFLVPSKKISFIKMVKIVPKINNSEGEEFCTGQAIKVLRIPNCE